MEQQPIYIQGYSGENRDDLISFIIMPDGLVYDDNGNKLIIEKEAIFNSKDDWIGKPILANHNGEARDNAMQCGIIQNTFYNDSKIGFVDGKGQIKKLPMKYDGLLMGVAKIDAEKLKNLGIDINDLLYKVVNDFEGEKTGTSCTYDKVIKYTKKGYRGDKEGEYTHITKIKPVEVSIIYDKNAIPRYNEECDIIMNSVKNDEVMTKEIENDENMKNFSTIGLHNKELFNIIKNNINECQNQLSKMFDNVVCFDNTGNGLIICFINDKKYEILLDLEKGICYVNDTTKTIIKFNIDKVFVFNGNYEYTDKELNEINKKLKNSISTMIIQVKKLLDNDKIKNSNEDLEKRVGELENMIKKQQKNSIEEKKEDFNFHIKNNNFNNESEIVNMTKNELLEEVEKLNEVCDGREDKQSQNEVKNDVEVEEKEEEDTINTFNKCMNFIKNIVNKNKVKNDVEVEEKEEEANNEKDIDKLQKENEELKNSLETLQKENDKLKNKVKNSEEEIDDKIVEEFNKLKNSLETLQKENNELKNKIKNDVIEEKKEEKEQSQIENSEEDKKEDNKKDIMQNSVHIENTRFKSNEEIEFEKRYKEFCESYNFDK